MTLMPSWWDEYMALNATGDPTIRDASGKLVVYDPATEPGINPVQDLYVANNFTLPSAFLSQVATLPATGNTSGLPASPINTIAATYDLVIPGDPVGAVLSRVQQFAEQIYGSLDPGVIRHSEGYLDADPTSGIRPGMPELPRVILPPWANVINRR